MIKLGKVYGNLMVDVRASNEKLQERAKQIVSEATGISLEESYSLLQITDFNVKLSIFMVLSKLDKIQAKKTLDKYDGHIAVALRNI